MAIAIIVLSVLMPVMTITAFIIGYNVNASKKLFSLPKKHKPTEAELMMERIDHAQVYKTETN